MKKKWIAGILALALFMVLPLTACNGGSQSASSAPSSTESGSSAPAQTQSGTSKRFLSIATAQLGGGTYNNGLAIATAANLGLSDCKVEALPTSGGIESARMLRDNEVEIASLDSYVVYMLKNGVEQFDKDGLDDVKLLFPLFTNYVNIVVPEDSSIQSVKDFAGKKVGVGNPGSIGYYLMTHIMRAYGLEAGDYTEVPLSASEQTDNLKNGMQDVFGYYTSQNSSAIMELAANLPCRWISLDADVWDPYAEKNGLPYTVTASTDTYDGMSQAMELTGAMWLCARGDVDEDTVYQFVKSFFENIQTAETMNATIKNTPNLLPTSNPVSDYHPGAIKYYKEMGWDFIEKQG